jgi:hypothetical protein
MYTLQVVKNNASPSFTTALTFAHTYAFRAPGDGNGNGNGGGDDATTTAATAAATATAATTATTSNLQLCVFDTLVDGQLNIEHIIGAAAFTVDDALLSHPTQDDADPDLYGYSDDDDDDDDDDVDDNGAALARKRERRKEWRIVGPRVSMPLLTLQGVVARSDGRSVVHHYVTPFRVAPCTVCTIM